jgi:hypothetical protein
MFRLLEGNNSRQQQHLGFDSAVDLHIAGSCCLASTYCVSESTTESQSHTRLGNYTHHRLQLYTTTLLLLHCQDGAGNDQGTFHPTNRLHCPVNRRSVLTCNPDMQSTLLCSLRLLHRATYQSPRCRGGCRTALGRIAPGGGGSEIPPGCRRRRGANRGISARCMRLGMVINTVLENGTLPLHLDNFQRPPEPP